MPEGPSIVILREHLEPFAGKKVSLASGSAKIDMDRITGEKIVAFKSHGKHTLICFRDFFIRIHLLMFGTWRINDEKELKPRLQLDLGKDVIDFYTCSVVLTEGDVNDHYDWSNDVMNPKWSVPKAKKAVKEKGNELICDLLLDQDIFAGVGNIIRNEILWRVKLHPLNHAEDLTDKQLTEVVKQAREYSLDFLHWKKKNELAKHWEAYKQKKCSRCGSPIVKTYPGKSKRRMFCCEHCQKLVER